MLTTKQAAWVGDSMQRVRNAGQRLRDRAAASERLAAPPIVPPFEHQERLYIDRPTCATCGRNLHRTESTLRECGSCEGSPAPLVAIQPEPIAHGCGCGPR